MPLPISRAYDRLDRRRIRYFRAHLATDEAHLVGVYKKSLLDGKMALQTVRWRGRGRDRRVRTQYKVPNILLIGSAGTLTMGLSIAQPTSPGSQS